MDETELSIGTRVLFQGITGVITGIGKLGGKTIYLLQAEQDTTVQGHARAEELSPALPFSVDESLMLKEIKNVRDLDEDKRTAFVQVNNILNRNN